MPSLRDRPSSLEHRKAEQLERFQLLRGEFAERYAAARAYDRPAWVTAEWRERNRALEDALLPTPPADFIRHPAILYSMFVPERHAGPELDFLLSRLDPADLLEEDLVGEPPVIPGHDGSYATSSNLVHHLHHLERFHAATGADPGRIDAVVEWGGGFGSLARLYLRLHGGAPTYVLVDTPLFSSLQWLYLASVLGPQGVVLLAAERHGVVQGKVNVVPAGLVPAIELDAELFVSTWALNESARGAQHHVLGRRWFGAPRLLLGMHDDDPLAARAVAQGARAVPLGDFMPHQSYLFR